MTFYVTFNNELIFLELYLGIPSVSDKGERFLAVIAFDFSRLQRTKLMENGFNLSPPSGSLNVF